MDLTYSSKEFLSGTKDFLDSNSFVAKISFVLLIIICFVIIFNVGYWVISLVLSPSKTPLLVDGMVDAKVPLSIPQAMNQKNAKPIYRSNDQYNGLEFTWSTWFYINDPTYRSEQNTKNIFVKGNKGNNTSQNQPFATNCPGVYLYSENSNNPNNYSSNGVNNLTMQLNIMMDIFPYQDPIDQTTKYNQEITIQDIPIKKWVNLIIRCNSQNIVDVFINSTLVQRAKLYNTVKQNYDNVYVAQNGGFDGFISNLKYYNYSIGTFEIDQIVSGGPNLKIDKDTNLKESNPYYLSTKWLFNESSPPPSQSWVPPST
jgi:hypothetical protein